MKKFIVLLLTFVCLMPSISHAMGFQIPSITLPEDSTVFSAPFAAQAISLCQTDAQALALMGLKVVHQDHFDKEVQDPSHTSAYTVLQGSVQHKGEQRPLMIVVIRATVGGEWYSNFDCAPSQSNDTQYAENFYFAAHDIHTGIQPVLAQVENPLIVLTGYSRGAACANLLGMMMNADHGVENVYVYTAATPNTVRGEAAKTECPNIFNIINPCDLITQMPLNSWGYTRLGTDIVLPGDEVLVGQLQGTMGAFAAIAPDINAYYTVRHSLTAAGESPFGLTTFEVMTRLASTLIGTPDPTVTAALQMLSPESDFAPLVGIFLSNGTEANTLMTQHAPNTYIQLFAMYQFMQR